MAFVDGAGNVELTSTTGSTASSFSTPIRIFSHPTLPMPDGPPTLVVFGGYLYAFFEGVDETNGNSIQSLYYNGSTWNTGGACTYTPSSVATGATDHSAVGAAVFNGKLVVGIQVGSSATSNVLTVCTATSTSSPGTFATYSSINPEGGIAAGVFNSSLYFAFKNNTSANYLQLAYSTDGVNFNWIIFDGEETSYKIQINGTSGYEIAPALLEFDSDLVVFYTANDNTHYLYQITSF